MITAIDTNILQALWIGISQLSGAVQRSLEDASEIGDLMICLAVYAELIAAPGRDRDQVDAFLGRKSIRTDWEMRPQVWIIAGEAYKAYSERRRKQERNEGPRRILADFLIGAHALHHGATLVTFDQGIYRTSFPGLTVLSPTIE